jgi:hypothetical protein
MAKTTEISFNCSGAEIAPYNKNLVAVTVEEPDVATILEGMDEDDLIEFVKNNFSPDDIFYTSVLDKWAESEGYIKADNQ